MERIKDQREGEPKGEPKSEPNSGIDNWLLLGQMRAEKCELKEARAAYEVALDHAEKAANIRSIMEAVSGLLRIAGEALDENAIAHMDSKLASLMEAYPKHVPPMAWYCRGYIAHHKGKFLDAMRCLRQYLLAVRSSPRNAFFSGHAGKEEALARGWAMIAKLYFRRNGVKRAEFVARAVLDRYEANKYRGLNGVIYLLMGQIAERHNTLELAMGWYRKAHGSFLSEHNWFYHLYVLYGYARISRRSQNYEQASWYLDLVDQAACGPEFALLRREIAFERGKIEKDAIDLVIDSRRCVVSTRENGPVSLRKQYVLLEILSALSDAHAQLGVAAERGLSKGEIIERVWKERYMPEAHDNKLYYNINRIRRLLEPDAKNPRYLLNWKEGYRFAPGLRVKFVNGGAKKAVQGGAK